MTSFRPFGEDFGTWYGLDEVGDLAVSVWGAGTVYLTRDQVADLRDHLNAVLANANDVEATTACCCADAGRVVSAARAWRDGRRDRVGGGIYHRQCRALYAAVNALDEEITPAELPVRRRVPTQAERIAAARADGHHRITEGGQTATDAMSDRYGETLDLIATAVETATDDTLRDGIRSMIRRVRPEALDLWSPPLAHRPATTEGDTVMTTTFVEVWHCDAQHCDATAPDGAEGWTDAIHTHGCPLHGAVIAAHRAQLISTPDRRRADTLWSLHCACGWSPRPDWSMLHHHHAPLRAQHLAHVRAQTTTEETPA